MRRVAVVAVVVALLGGACGMDQRAKKEAPARTFSASRLGMPTTSMWEALTPDQRQALRDGEMYEEFPSEDEMVEVDEESADGTTMEKVESVSVSLLSIGVTLGAMAAPFLLF
ncbi:MAG: hypothetical protein KIT14_10455 [bacterium]|nr:hypothetical protein [bacterium]